MREHEPSCPANLMAHGRCFCLRIKDERIASLRSQLAAANARIAELEAAEERAFMAGYEVAETMGREGPPLDTWEDHWRDYKAGGES